METYAHVLNYAIPFFFTMIVIEAVIAKRMGRKINRSADTISSISGGITNVVKEVLGVTIVIISYGWIADKIAIIELEATWLIYLVGFIGMDFAGYWRHRIRHEVNVLWNGHISHHSSEEFNLSCGLRLPFVRIFSLVNFFLFPAAILGVPQEVIAMILPLHFILQFWYHTQIINKMGWLETFLVTPSHHRVHHAINPEYLNKNYGNVFIFWDKWFGTFQPELEEVPPVYGVTRPVKTWNPVIINFQHLWLLIKDTWRTRNYWDKFRIWFMPTNWRPTDMKEKYPVHAVEDVGQIRKYDSKPSSLLLNWVWFQLTLTLVLMLFLFNRFAEIDFPGVFVYGAFLFVSIFSFTALLDKAIYALSAELLRMIFGLSLIWWQGGWFGMQKLLPESTIILILVLIGSVIGTGYFYFAEIQKESDVRLKLRP